MSRAIALRMVLAAVVIGTILRFSGIDSRSLWGDEITSLAFATGHVYFPSSEDTEPIHNADHYRRFLYLTPTYFSERLVSLLRHDTQLPLYYFLLNLWLHLFGASEAGLRSLSVVASIGTIPLIYALGRGLFSVEAGVYSALIFSVAPFQLAYGEYARPYALLVFLAALSTFFALGLCGGGKKWGWLVGYFTAATLGLYTHYLFVWNFVFHSVLVTLRQRTNWSFLKLWGLMQGCVVIAYLPWLDVLVDQIYWNRGANPVDWFYWYSKVVPWMDVLLYAGRDLALLLSAGRIEGFCRSGQQCFADVSITGISYGIPILMISLCCWRFLSGRGVRPSEWSAFRNGGATCFLWGFCAFSGPLIIDILVGSHMIKTPYYFISASLPLYLAIAMVVATIANKVRRALVMCSLVFFLLAGSGLYLQGFGGTIKYEQGMREVARYFDRAVKTGDLVLVLNPGPNPIDLAYYLKSNPEFARVNIPERWRSAGEIATQLEKIMGGRKRVWFVDDRGPEVAARSTTLAWLRAHYGEIELREFKNLSVFFFSLR